MRGVKRWDDTFNEMVKFVKTINCGPMGRAPCDDIPIFHLKDHPDQEHVKHVLGCSDGHGIYINKPLRCRHDLYVALHELAHWVLGHSGRSQPRPYAAEHYADEFAFKLMAKAGHPASDNLKNECRDIVREYCEERNRQMPYLEAHDWDMEVCKAVGFTPDFTKGHL